MAHRILEQLEEDIKAQAKRNLADAEKTGKPLIAPNAIMAYELMINNFISMTQEVEQEQSLNNEPVNFKKEN